MPTRRTFVALAASSALPLSAQPEFFPSGPPTFAIKPFRIVVPNAAGGAADITARLVGQKLAAAFGQPVTIDNRPGAGGVIAGELVARAEPDGQILLLISSGTAVSAALFKSLPFDTLEDFAPASLLATFDLAIASAEGGRFKTLADVLAHARANPGKLNIGTPQVGTTQHLAAELFKAGAGIEAQVVPFNGTPPAITALRGGVVDVVVDILGPLMPQIASHALRALAVMGEKRAPQLPDVPAVRESGGALSAFDVSSWNGLAVPRKTPRVVVERISREVQAAMAQADVKKRLLELNLVAQGSTPVQLRERLAGDIRRWEDVILRAKIPRQ